MCLPAPKFSFLEYLRDILRSFFWSTPVFERLLEKHDFDMHFMRTVREQLHEQNLCFLSPTMSSKEHAPPSTISSIFSKCESVSNHSDESRRAVVYVAQVLLQRHSIPFDSRISRETIIPKLTCSLQNLYFLEVVRDTLRSLSEVKFDDRDPAHLWLLESTWYNLQEGRKRTASKANDSDALQSPCFPLDQGARISSMWPDIGFQGHDPASDFRGMGILGLMLLQYFSHHFRALSLLSISQMDLPWHGYPFAITAIAMTEWLCNIFKAGILDGIIGCWADYGTIFDSNDVPPGIDKTKTQCPDQYPFPNNPRGIIGRALRLVGGIDKTKAAFRIRSYIEKNQLSLFSSPGEVLPPAENKVSESYNSSADGSMQSPDPRLNTITELRGNIESPNGPVGSIAQEKYIHKRISDELQHLFVGVESYGWLQRVHMAWKAGAGTKMYDSIVSSTFDLSNAVAKITVNTAKSEQIPLLKHTISYGDGSPVYTRPLKQSKFEQQSFWQEIFRRESFLTQFSCSNGDIVAPIPNIPPIMAPVFHIFCLFFAAFDNYWWNRAEPPATSLMDFPRVFKGFQSYLLGRNSV